ncbi:MAG TPA: hypothetical protein VFE29_05595 [Terriglobia bacterium]|nr:hypothetical protein [Terriglobia bacterium]
MAQQLESAPVRLKPEIIRVGDFAYCRSKRYRDSLELPKELGLVIEIKRANYKLLYASDKRAWVPRDVLVLVPAPPAGSSLLQTLHYLLRRTNAHECEIISSDDKHHLAARIDEIDHTTVDELRTYLADKFVSLKVVPEGMAFMQLEVDFTQ